MIPDPFDYVEELSCSLTTEQLMEITKNNHIEVYRFPCARNALAIRIDGSLFIAINEHLTIQQTREALAHELGHCLTGGFYSLPILRPLRSQPMKALQTNGHTRPFCLSNG